MRQIETSPHKKDKTIVLKIVTRQILKSPSNTSGIIFPGSHIIDVFYVKDGLSRHWPIRY
jgi:hypothetical protein